MNAAASLHQSWRILECVCPEEISRQHLADQSASAHHPAGNRDFQLYLEVKSRFEAITLPKTVIDTSQPLEICVEQALAVSAECYLNSFIALAPIQSCLHPIDVVPARKPYDSLPHSLALVLCFLPPYRLRPILKPIRADGQRSARVPFTIPPSLSTPMPTRPSVFSTKASTSAQPIPTTLGHLSLDKARRGNLGAEFFSIWVDPETNQGHFAQHTFDLIDSVYEQAAHHPDRMMMAFSVADIERAHHEHKLAALMGIEGGHSIENDMHLLRDYYRLGVRYMTLSWSNTNEWADSSGDINDPKIQHHNGLTDFGKQVVLEMNRLGMMVDISHVADKTFWDAIATTKAPVIASHSSARALVDAPRNMTDDMLRAVAKNGGVVQVNFFSGFDDQTYRQSLASSGQGSGGAAIQKYSIA